MTMMIRRILMILATAVLLSCLAQTASAETVAKIAVPEPGTIALLGTGLLLCARLLRRKKEDGEETAA